MARVGRSGVDVGRGEEGGGADAVEQALEQRNSDDCRRSPEGEGGTGNGGRGSASTLEELARRRGVDEAWNALEEMQRQGQTTDKFTVSRMLMKTVSSGRCRLNPPRVYRGLDLVDKFIDMQPEDVDEVLFNSLLDTCCRLKDLPRLEATMQRMRDLQVSPSPVTLGILVKTYGQAGDFPKVLQVWADMEEQRVQANAVTYGCMMDACVKCGHVEKALEIFQGMREGGKHRNTILYATLIKGYGMEKDLPNALALFREMPLEEVPYNTITYNSIIDVSIKCGDLATAEKLLREMTAPESLTEPDLISFSTLLKGYCHVGDIDKALQVAEAIKARGLRKDELVFNTLMDGCVKANDITAGVGLFEEMIKQAMRPSLTTHNILIRLYERAGYEEEALEAVTQLYHHHKIEQPQEGDRSRGFSKKGRSQKSPPGTMQPSFSKFGEWSADFSPVGSPVSIPKAGGGASSSSSSLPCPSSAGGASPTHFMEEHAVGTFAPHALAWPPLSIPLSSVHDLAHAGFLGNQQAYFANWTPEGQQMGSWPSSGDAQVLRLPPESEWCSGSTSWQ